MQPDPISIEVIAPIIPSARPDAHTQKYDRQLRLWASGGQSALENASILVIGGTATGAGILKNLVLPGIGKFTILDDELVKGEDVGNNFFLEKSCLGKNRAEQVVKYLGELNSDVVGLALNKNIKTVLATEPKLLLDYSLIIAVDVNPSCLIELSDLCWDNDISLLKVKSCGFYGLVKTQFKELTIVESHPETLIDLRLQSPFPALLEFAGTFDYEKLDSMEHGHVPAVIILAKGLVDWKAAHEGIAPSNSADRLAFTKFIKSQKRTSDEENFDEAVDLYRRAGVKPLVPKEIEELFTDPSCLNLSPTSSNFWLLTRTLKDFVKSSSGLLPLTGILPDMKASSSKYVTLQTIFRTKAKEDLDTFKGILEVVLKSGGIEEKRIGDEEIEIFVKHTKYLKVIRGRSLRQELENNLLKGGIESLKQSSAYAEIPDETLEIYLTFSVAEKFFLLYERFPGTSEDDTDGTKDVIEMERIAIELLKTLEGGEMYEKLGDVIKEVCRAGNCDLPQIAALMGGIASQEVIKLVTRQYEPLNGTCIFNGIRSGTGIIQG